MPVIWIDTYVISGILLGLMFGAVEGIALLYIIKNGQIRYKTKLSLWALILIFDICVVIYDIIFIRPLAIDSYYFYEILTDTSTIIGCLLIMICARGLWMDG
jgi:hypothetical protein